MLNAQANRTQAVLNMVPGAEIDGYIIGERIGEGGMGIVYQAFKPGTAEKVAVKILLDEYASDIDYRQRFEREILAMRALDHPNIIPIYAHGEQDGALYFVMRLIRGSSLASRLEKQPFSPLETWDLLEPVADAIDYAHQKNIIHRDIKPANILIESTGSAQNRGIHPYLADFGLSKLLDLPPLTRKGSQVGTPYYMSPEQIMADTLTTRSDVYALGVVLYEMLTGLRPFAGDTPQAIALQHLDAPPPLPSLLFAGFPEPIEEVVLRALAKSPADRYATTKDFSAAYLHALQQTGQQAADQYYWPRH